MKTRTSLIDVLLPESSIGWTGGDSYVTNLYRILTLLENDGHVKILNRDRKVRFVDILASKFFPKSTEAINRRRFEALNLPWPLISGIRNPVQWIPDLQEIDEPQFFSIDEREKRKEQIEAAAEINTAFYFSSNYSLELFKREFPNAKTLSVVRFSVFKDKAISKFPVDCVGCLQHGFYYVPNTWWKHKNHLLLLSAFREYKNSGGKKHLVLTGSEEDYRWPLYSDEVRTALRMIDNSHNVGFCDSDLKSALYRDAFCVIQPSIYEGWSTIVEEALIFNKKLIVSDLPVFEEQLEGESGYKTFYRDNTQSLTDAMFATENEQNSVVKRNYEKRHQRFYSDAKNLILLAETHRNLVSS